MTERKDWLTIYLVHARHCAHQPEPQPELVSHLWHIAFQEDWQPLKDYLHQTVGLPESVVASVGLGRWIPMEPPDLEYQPGSEVGVAPSHRFGDRAVSVEQDSIRLKRAGQLVAMRSIEPAPLGAFGAEEPRPQEQALIFSPDGRWIWHLGYRQQRPCVTLMDGLSLDVVDTFQPMSWSPYDSDYGEPLSEWSDTWWSLCVSVSGFHPDVLLAWSNWGDKPHVFMTLRATLDGIVDEGGASLVEEVSGSLDMYIVSALFVSEYRLLISDDMGLATLFSWPEAEVLEHGNVLPTPDEYDCIKIWPEGEPVEDCEVTMGGFVSVLNGNVVFELDEGGLGLNTLGVCRVDGITFQGCIRPPTTGIKTFHLYRGDVFCSVSGEVRFWRYKPLFEEAG